MIDDKKKIYSPGKILIIIILGLVWFLITFVTSGIGSSNDIISILAFTGPYFGLVTLIWGIIKFFERRKVVKKDS